MPSDYEIDLTLSINRHDSLGDIASVAHRGEELGFENVGFGETNGWDSTTVQTCIAERTESIGISNDVMGPYSRSPTQIAQAAASVHSLAEGRTRVGLGTSSPALVGGFHGLDFDQPLRRLRESVEIVKLALAGESITYDGEIFTPEGFELDVPMPDSIPVDVAALSPKGAELAGRFADGWIPQLLTPDGLEERLEHLRRGAALGDRDPESLRTSIVLRTCALENSERAKELGRKHVAFMVSVYGPFYRKSIAGQGYEDMVEEVRSRWMDGDREGAIAAVEDDVLDKLVACGSPEEVNDIVDEFGSIDGCDAVRLGWIGPAGANEIEATMEAVAPINRD
jgi:coenzyme F420-dependent oxidoreductase